MYVNTRNLSVTEKFLREAQTKVKTFGCNYFFRFSQWNVKPTEPLLASVRDPRAIPTLLARCLARKNWRERNLWLRSKLCFDNRAESWEKILGSPSELENTSEPVATAIRERNEELGAIRNADCKEIQLIWSRSFIVVTLQLAVAGTPPPLRPSSRTPRFRQRVCKLREEGEITTWLRLTFITSENGLRWILNYWRNAFWVRSAFF